MVSQETRSTGQTYAVPNIVYDVITLIHEKSKGLEAFDQYMQDAQGQGDIANLLQQLQQQDRDAVNQLTQQLRQLLSKGGSGQGGSSQ